MTDTKIQINSLEALERLIGGDSELEMQIRTSVVQDFTKKHLKALATDDLMKKTALAVQKEIYEEFFTQVKSGWNQVTVFKPGILEELRENLKFTARAELRAIVSELIEDQKVNDSIKTRLAEAEKYILDNLTNEVLEERLNRMVEIRLKEKLGIK